jgi:apoptosis-inducing factor 3
MSSGQEEAAGPDLRAGIPTADLPDGAMIAGHVDGESVLLAHRGNEWFAIGATCTHYGGPLAEGLMVGETVRCPWHHACFSLRTGSQLRPPALNDLPSWEVEVGDGVVRVGAKRPPVPRPSRRAKGPESVVIVGGGAAGNCAAETL